VFDLALASQNAAASGWAVVTTVSAVIAAAVSACALFYARKTVVYARQTVTDGRAAHREAMNTQAQASNDFETAHREAMTAQQQGRDDFTAAHNQQMVQRDRAMAEEVRLQRLAQAARVSEILSSIARTALSEALNPPVPIPGSQRPTFLHSEQAHLRAALAVFYALQGSRLETADELAQLAISATTPATDVLRLANNGQGELMRLIRKG
jgi:hypothetical protein